MKTTRPTELGRLGAMVSVSALLAACGGGGGGAGGNGGGNTTSQTSTNTTSQTDTNTTSDTSTNTTSQTTTSTGNGTGATPDLVFGSIHGIVGEHVGFALTTDAAGNIYTSGRYDGDIDFGLGVLPPAGKRYLLKLDPAGHPLWQKSYGGGLIRSMLTDAAGNLLVVGSVYNGTDLGNGPVNLSTGQGLFVMKIDPAGTPLWIKTFATYIGNDVYDWMLAIGPSSELAVIATLKTDVDLGGGTLAAHGKRDVVVAKLDAAGGHLWSKRFGGPDEDLGIGVAVDAQGAVLITGQAMGIDLGGGPLGATGTMFLAKLDSAGQHVWSKALGGGPGDVAPSGMTLDPSGNITVTGMAPAGFDLGGGTQFAAGADSTCFVAKLSGSGAHLWSRAFGCGLPEDVLLGPRVATGPDGSVAVSGTFTGVVDFGFGPLMAKATDALVYRLDAGGNPLWVKPVRSQGVDNGQAIAVDASGNVISTGWVDEDVDLGGGLLDAHGSMSVFLAKYGP